MQTESSAKMSNIMQRLVSFHRQPYGVSLQSLMDYCIQPKMK